MKFLHAAISCGYPGNGTGVAEMQGDSYYFGDEVHYLCLDAYHDSVSRDVAVTLTCTADGNWSRQPPACIGW